MSKSYTNYKCNICNVKFGNKVSNYNRHMLTSKHSALAKENQTKIDLIEKTKLGYQSDAMMELLKLLKGQTHTDETQVDCGIKETYKRKIFPNPKLTFSKFFSLENIIKHCEMDNIYEPIGNIIYNGIINMVRITLPTDLPIIVANKSLGSRGRIYYFNDNLKFEYQSCNKIKERTVFIKFQKLLTKGVRQLFKSHLTEIWENMPCDIKHYFNNTHGGIKKIWNHEVGSRLLTSTILWDDFVCINDFLEHGDEDNGCHIPGCKCWNSYAVVYDTEEQQRTSHRYMNKPFYNEDEAFITFKETDEIDRVKEDLIEYLENHKLFKTFLKFKRMNNNQRKEIHGERVTVEDLKRLFEASANKVTKLIRELNTDFDIEQLYENIKDQLE